MSDKVKTLLADPGGAKCLEDMVGLAKKQIEAGNATQQIDELISAAGDLRSARMTHGFRVFGEYKVTLMRHSFPPLKIEHFCHKSTLRWQTMYKAHSANDCYVLVQACVFVVG